LRTGNALMRATKPFAKEIPSRSWSGLIGTVAVWAALVAAVVLLPWWWAKAIVSLPLGLVIVRLFILYHDYCHGAIFRRSKVAKPIMTAIGWYTMAVPSVWRETHNYHHANNSKLTGSSIGSYPIVSLGVYKVLKPKKRQQLKVVRHPLFMVLGLFTTFFVGMSISPFLRDRKQHWTAPLALAAWWGILIALTVFAGWQIALFGWLVPGIISCAAGSYLFYAQHNFPDARFQGRREWEFTRAALESSSMFDMGPVMHWFTGNIGYHHIHHLNDKIPWYRLPEAYRELPELQQPGRTSWSMRDIAACLRCHVWDPERGRMISFADADAAMEQIPAAAK
jgi:acyl-lipid omega-6 desaturase (Delta-12 desaturase)